MAITSRRSNTNLLEDKQEEYWWFGGSTDEEITSSEYDVEGLDLGAESPRSNNNSMTNLLDHAAYVKQWAESNLSVPRVLERTPSWSSFASRRRHHRRPDSSSSSSKDDDRDCGICFEYAVRPCRTLCCGRIFCTEHLADWLHGPNAEGRCPNCENACSLEGSTLSLTSPQFIPTTSQSPPGKQRHAALTPAAAANHSVFHPSPLSVAQPRSNYTLDHPPTETHDSFDPPLRPPIQTQVSTSTSQASDPDQTTSSADGEADNFPDHHHHHHHHHHHPYMMKRSFAGLGSASASAINLTSTTPFSSSWGALSRLMSIITFLMFIYKLLS